MLHVTGKAPPTQGETATAIVTRIGPVCLRYEYFMDFPF